MEQEGDPPVRGGLFACCNTNTLVRKGQRTWGTFSGPQGPETLGNIVWSARAGKLGEIINEIS